MRAISGLAALLVACATANAQDAESGQAIFRKWCAPCHVAASALYPTPPGTLTLQKRYGNSVPAALEQRTDLTPAFIESIVRNGLNAMPPFRKTEVPDADLASISAYLTRKKP